MRSSRDNFSILSYVRHTAMITPVSLRLTRLNHI